MNSQLVSIWFGRQFKYLHPEIRELHTHGGVLKGVVDVSFGAGLGQFLGQRLARKMNIPGEGSHQFSVEISHHSDGLHWDRTFNHSTKIKSIFTPVGTIENGYWLEETGPLKMRLTVDIREGGWHWRYLGFRFMGIPLPRQLFPELEAYKTIENGLYRFHVGLSVPIIGSILVYRGLLNVEHSVRHEC